MMTNKTLTAALSLATPLLLLLNAACDKPAEGDGHPRAEAPQEAAEAAPEQPKAEAAEPEARPAEDSAAAANDGPIAVPAEGKVLEPAVAVDRIPEGAWYCDMGTVHYARGEEGDGKCPECGMKLVKREAAKAAPHGHDHGEGDGHDHGGEGHGDHGHAH